ncbi:MAG TPA: hypothetical protein VGE09_08500 [Pseudoxanthomonas sp.]
MKPPSKLAVLRVEMHLLGEKLKKANADRARLRERVKTLEREVEEHRYPWNRRMAAAERMQREANTCLVQTKDLIDSLRKSLNRERAARLWRGPTEDIVTGEIMQTADEYADRVSSRGLIIRNPDLH